MAGVDVEQIAEDACQEVCEEYAVAGLDAMMSMCGNAGQESIIDAASGDYYDAAMDCIEGDAADFSTAHDEAVGEIVDVGNEYLQEAADKCQEIRLAAATFEMDDLGDWM
jgi:hypothetical protein